MNYEDWLEELRARRITSMGKMMDYLENEEYTSEDIYNCIPEDNLEDKANYLLNYFRNNEGHLPTEEPKVTEKQKLRLVIADNSSSKEYVNFLSEVYDVTVVKHGDTADLVLFTGGEDVFPSYYGEKVGKHTSYNERRDKLEQDVYENYRYTPKLGICRGNQFLAVMKGGKLIQHVSGHGQSHYVTTKDGMNIEVTSTHHQMVYPFDLPQDRYELIAWSKNFRSSTYLNGNDEEIDLHRDFLEVEIIKWGNDALGIQGHPEYSSASSHFKKYALQLIQQLIGEYGEKSISNKYSIKPKIGQLNYYDNYGIKLNPVIPREPLTFRDFNDNIHPIIEYTGRGEKPSLEMKEEISDTNQFLNFYEQELQKQLAEDKNKIAENPVMPYDTFNIVDLENVLSDLSKNKK